MAAWDDDARWSDEAVERAEDSVTDHLAYDGSTDYDWQPEATIDELCAAIDEATNVYQLLADDTAELTSLVARRVA